MRDSNGVPAPIDLSVQLYIWLLAAYPTRFRAEYGVHMAQVFRDVCRRDYRRGGLAGMASLIGYRMQADAGLASETAA